MPPHFHQSKLILIREIIPKNKAVEFSAALSHTADFESASSDHSPGGHSNIRSPTLGKAVLCMVAGHLRV